MPILHFVSARISLSVALMSAAAGLCVAQVTGWSVPASGFVYDSPSLSIRPVTGFVGSALLGAPVVSNADFASIAPNQKSAIVRQGTSLLWISDLGNPGQTSVLSGLSQARRIFWASDSSQAVLLTPENSLIWLKIGGSAPLQTAAWQLGAMGPRGARGQRSGWVLLAADAAADRVLLAAGGAENQQIWTASRTSRPSQISFAGDVTAAAFASQSGAAYVADAASHQILRLDQLAGSSSATPVVTSATYLKTPVGLALSTDDARIALIDQGAGMVRVFDAASGTLLNELPIDSVPETVVPVTAGRFLLDSAAASALYFLDTGLPPTVFFVPRGE